MSIEEFDLAADGDDSFSDAGGCGSQLSLADAR